MKIRCDSFKSSRRAMVTPTDGPSRMMLRRHRHTTWRLRRELASRSRSDQFKRSADLDGITDGTGYRAMIRVNAVDSLDRFPRFLLSPELVVDRDPTDDENASLQLDLPYSVRCELSV